MQPELRVKALHKYINPDNKEVSYLCLLEHGNNVATASVIRKDTLLDWERHVDYVEFINLKPSVTESSIIELEPIRVEKYFKYGLSYVDYTACDGSTQGVLGWTLQMLDYLDDINFKCPSMYFGYPVISLENAFCYNSDTQYELMRHLKQNGKKLDLRGLDTSNIMTMRSMFYHGTVIKELNMQGCKTPQLIHARNIFSGCGNLESINIDSMTLPKHLKLADIFLPNTDYKAMQNIVVSKSVYRIFEKENYKSRLTGENIQQRLKAEEDKAKLLGIEPPIRINLTVKK